MLGDVGASKYGAMVQISADFMHMIVLRHYQDLLRYGEIMIHFDYPHAVCWHACSHTHIHDSKCGNRT